jgi:hypothetical protein
MSTPSDPTRVEPRLSADDAPRGEPAYRPTQRANRKPLVAALLLLSLAAAGLWWWFQGATRKGDEVPALPASVAKAPTPEPAAAPPAPAATAATPVEPTEPTIRNPIASSTATGPTSSTTLDNADLVIPKALGELLGAKTVATMLRSDDFIRRTVATVDGLGRNHAAPRIWPINPTEGRFTASRQGDTDVIGAANAARYARFVGLVESIDITRTAAFYKAWYPLLQTAYKELGYPQGYFNDRLVAVIDQLTATPEPAQPIEVKLVEIKGEAAAASTQPWTRYEFVDPRLEALPAGSKMLLRMGLEHSRKVKAKLRAFRGSIATLPPVTNR